MQSEAGGDGAEKPERKWLKPSPVLQAALGYL